MPPSPTAPGPSSSRPRAVVGGNWKMNGDRASCLALARAVHERTTEATARVDVVIFPPFPYLAMVGELLASLGSRVTLGAQDAYHAARGAFTGEVSVGMLKDVGVGAVLAGHSERRHVLHEGDDLVNLKVRAVLGAGLRCVLCVGERLEQRLTDQTDTVNERQVRLGLREVGPEHLGRLVIAYEPVWAIGTGKTATPADAQDAQAKIRRVLADLFGAQAAATVPVQYGGSVTPAGAAELMAQSDVNGALVGGASLKGEDFAAIVEAAAWVASRA